MIQHCRLVMAMALIAAAAGMVSAGEMSGRIYVASHKFVVTVAPVDEESRNADSAHLYLRRDPGQPWKDIGVCAKTPGPGGVPLFPRTHVVEADGVYYFTSRPVVGGRVISEPDMQAPPQATVVVDTLPPAVEFTAPTEDWMAEAGRDLRIAWKAVDENFGPAPIALSWSGDGGSSWQDLAGGFPAEGDTVWPLPANLSGPALIRATALDLAGNSGQALRRIEAVAFARPETAPPQPVVVDVPKAPEPPKVEPPAEKKKNHRNRSWLYYLMAVNNMRQGKPKEALQYYWLALKEDPEFIDAWADTALAYIDLGAYKTAREIAEKTRAKAPDRTDLMHLLGETYHAEAMELLGRAKSREDRAKAKELIQQAVKWYGAALEKAKEDWLLAEQAPSFYRLGEICYFINMDREGARAYWEKILELHSPTPNSDLLLWAPPDEKDQARQRYRRYTYMRVSLETWQNWARGYLAQLDERERQGIYDLTPVPAGPSNRPGATDNPFKTWMQAEGGQGCLPLGDAVDPGRDRERSLFSLPGQYGSPAPVPAGPAGASRQGGDQPPGKPAGKQPKKRGAKQPFYSSGARETEDETYSSGSATRGGASMFTGGPDAPPPPNPDPYAFPQGNRKTADWYGDGPYGDRPISGW